MVSSKDTVSILAVFLKAFLITTLISLSQPASIYDEVDDGGQKSNPGLKLRITQNGLNYVNEILRYEMSRIIPHLRLDDIEQSEGRGYMRITNGKVTSYKQPSNQKLTLQPSDELLWKSSGADIGMNGHVIGSFGRLNAEGDVDVLASDVDLVLVIHPLRQENGQFGVKVRSCDCNVGSMDYHVYNAPSMIGHFLENNKGPLIRRAKPRIEQRICNQATKVIDQAGNEQLSSRPTKIPLNEAAEKLDTSDEDHDESKKGNKKEKKEDKDNFFALADDGDDGDSRLLQKEMSKNITKHMVFDYGNVKDPVVQSRYIETYNRGEVSYHGQGGTPFYPQSTRESGTPPSDRMVYAVASQYVVNSMLYNAYQHDLLKTRISERDTPDFKSYLKTTCDAGDLFGLCLGSIVPEMQRSFPNSDAEIEIQAVDKVPAILFRSDGSIDILGKVLVKLLAVKSGQHRVMLSAVIDSAGKAKLFTDDKRIKGNCTITKYDLTMKENNLKGFDKERQQEFTNSSKALVATVLNMHLRHGMRLPATKTMKLKNTKLHVFDKTIRIESDLEADKDALTKKAIEAIRRNGGHVEGL